MSQKRVKGLSISRPIVFGNTAWRMSEEERGPSDHTHRWTLSVRSAAAPEPSEGQLSGAEPPDIGGGDDLSYFIKRVSFKLHETYPQPLRNIDKPPFEITETGWGEFEVQIRIFFVNEANEKPIGPFMHFVKLHPWTAVVLVAPNNIKPPPHMIPPPPSEKPPAAEKSEGEKDKEKPADGTSEDAKPADDDAMAVDPAPPTAGEAEKPPDQPPTAEETVNIEEEEEPVIIDSPVHSYQYDEIVFHEPLESFYNLLLNIPPTPLPKEPRLPKPDPAIPLGAAGNVGELTLDTERREGERLEYARITTLAEIDNMRKKIAEHERTLEELRAARGVVA